MAQTSSVSLGTNPRHHYVTGTGAVDKRLKVKWHKGKRVDCKICLTSRNGNEPQNNI